MTQRIRVEETPNPNARKFVVDTGTTAMGPRRAYYSAEAAAGDPLARRLFDLPHVTGVMMLHDFCTVLKSPRVRWGQLAPRIQAILTAYGESDQATRPEPTREEGTRGRDG